MPPRLGGDETPDVRDPDVYDANDPLSPEAAPAGRREGKGGKPPLIVFLPDGKGYVLPPFRDIQQVSYGCFIQSFALGLGL